MRLRSLLFVPGDRPERFVKAAQSGADAIILDLEDAVAPAAKPKAREAVADYLSAPADVARFVRINAIDGPYLEADLVAARGADGIVLPKAVGAATVRSLALLAPMMKILPIATETPQAIFGLGTYGEVAEHLYGLTWGAEDLPAAIGAMGSRRADGSYTAPFEMVRSMALFGAHAAGVAAIETVYPAIRDLDGLAAYAARGAFDGFTGMMALHPDQVPIINAAFTPSAQQVEQARAIIAAFADAPGAGVLILDGKMIDAPHLARARNIIARTGGAALPDGRD
ncbi:HpcH/HpaI aldolase/citrate lyase family protein [Novosphingobium sediminicola]|uniref:Citrate lyase subunit beta/citryl-CoA lyase n=1 Tax=Novosphingobium sediminicola TaxID=563162 RepID=A0A7W6CIV9_9SPHN|nr:CoA ester lyase [Novosphingobium sediminicola]MBB3953886.1 citrate lyase subunit beta/citryl-CoA lyase [Novosphingobium sediminicola]